MNSDIINNEITSPALKEIVASLNSIVERVQTGGITHKQGSVEIAGHKHVIQTVALDWLYNKHSADIKKLEQKLSA